MELPNQRSLKMQSKTLSLGALAVALGVLAIPAAAAPAVGDVDGLKGASTSATEHVAYRRCWYEDGRRHCRRTVTRYYNYYDDGYYGYGPGYYGPGIGLYFGGGGHRHGHGHRGHR
jgi:hypothetical protein